MEEMKDALTWAVKLSKRGGCAEELKGVRRQLVRTTTTHTSNFVKQNNTHLTRLK